MAKITHLHIQQLRNLELIEIELNSKLNFFYGANGSGKTSLLEALYLLSNNRSFRTNKLNYTIRNTADESLLFCKLLSDTPQRLGIKRARSGSPEIRLNGLGVSSSAQLARLLPSIAVEPATFDLLDAGPSRRRSVLDWLVFHVKHEFHECWKAYQRCLKQRNILLRHDKIPGDELRYWESLLIDQALKLEELRSSVAKELGEQLLSVLSSRSGRLQDMSLMYKSGWPDLDVSLSSEHQAKLMQQALDSTRLRDCKQGFTSVGSHKFDLLFRIGKQPAAELLSRGQKKTLIVCLYLCLGEIYLRSLGESPMYLLDDLASELDQDHLQFLIEQLEVQDAQCFISTVEKQSFDSLAKKMTSSWFHVKHGTTTAEDNDE